MYHWWPVFWSRLFLSSTIWKCVVQCCNFWRFVGKLWLQNFLFGVKNWQLCQVRERQTDRQTDGRRAPRAMYNAPMRRRHPKRTIVDVLLSRLVCCLTAKIKIVWKSFSVHNIDTRDRQTFRFSLRLQQKPPCRRLYSECIYFLCNANKQFRWVDT